VVKSLQFGLPFAWLKNKTASTTLRFAGNWPLLMQVGGVPTEIRLNLAGSTLHPKGSAWVSQRYP
jgi:hypothetical protein